MEQLIQRTYRRSNIPLYLQVASTLRRRIETGHWKPGDKISTIEELEREFGVARVTVRQAIDMLHGEGLVRRQQGKGTFVSKKIKEKRWLRFELNLSPLLETIKDNVPKFLNADSGTPPRLNAGDGDPADEYVHLKSVQYRNKEPYGLVSVHVAKRVFDLAPDDFRSHTALPILPHLEGVTIGRAHQTMVIATADLEAAHLLKLALNAPTAEARCVVTDDQDVAIYVGEIIYRGDCIKFDFELLQNVSDGSCRNRADERDHGKPR